MALKASNKLPAPGDRVRHRSESPGAAEVCGDVPSPGEHREPPATLFHHQPTSHLARREKQNAGAVEKPAGHLPPDPHTRAPQFINSLNYYQLLSQAMNFPMSMSGNRWGNAISPSSPHLARQCQRQRRSRAGTHAPRGGHPSAAPGSGGPPGPTRSVRSHPTHPSPHTPATSSPRPGEISTSRLESCCHHTACPAVVARKPEGRGAMPNRESPEAKDSPEHLTTPDTQPAVEHTFSEELQWSSSWTNKNVRLHGARAPKLSFATQTQEFWDSPWPTAEGGHSPLLSALPHTDLLLCVST